MRDLGRTCAGPVRVIHVHETVDAGQPRLLPAEPNWRQAASARKGPKPTGKRLHRRQRERQERSDVQFREGASHFEAGLLLGLDAEELQENWHEASVRFRDFAAYCERDYRSLYLGQTGHLSSKRARSKNDPHGYYEMRGKVNGLCFYTSFANGNKALCNIPTNSHRWKAPSSSSDIFLCGKEVMKSFKVQLGGKNGVRAKGYELKVVKLTSIAGSYSNLMIKMCKKFDMKPIW